MFVWFVFFGEVFVCFFFVSGPFLWPNARPETTFECLYCVPVR